MNEGRPVAHEVKTKKNLKRADELIRKNASVNTTLISIGVN